MKQVLVKPLWSNELGGRLFQIAYPWEFHDLKNIAAGHGIAFESWDMMPIENADCVWVLELPERRTELETARRKARKGVPFILQVMETPTARAQSFDPRNYDFFDYVATYQQNPPNYKKCYTYRLPNCYQRWSGEHMPYAARKCAVMINTNRIEGWLTTRKSGLVGLPGVGPFFSGWNRPLWAYFVPAKGELYSWRRNFARLAGKVAPHALEVHGKGWNGERISWNPLVNNSPYSNRASNGDLDKLELISNFRFTIAVENYRGSMGYISEKIFEPMMAGSVPVYLGEEKILDAIPKEAFVDVRKFKNHKHLLDYLQKCPESEWRGMYQAGQEFLASDGAPKFSKEAFVKNMIDMLLDVLKLKTSK
jgi:hypothetical protein